MRWRDAVCKDSEAIYKFLECKSESKIVPKLTVSHGDKPDRVSRPSYPNGFQHSWVTKLSAAKFTVKHLPCICLYIEIMIKNFYTSGFLNSFGLMHLMKNGLHSPRVVISRSKDLLNCAERVTVFLLFWSFPNIFKSSANKEWRNLFLVVGISARRSPLKLSLFFSRNPLVL